MRVLAVDPGAVRVGLAVSDETGTLARPLEAYQRTASIKRDARAVAALADELSTDLIVVGLPLQMDATHGAAAVTAEEFAERVSRYTRTKIKMLDERLTTVEAGRRLHETGMDSRKARKVIDSQAAATMLQSYLDSMSKTPPEVADAS